MISQSDTILLFGRMEVTSQRYEQGALVKPRILCAPANAENHVRCHALAASDGSAVLRATIMISISSKSRGLFPQITH